jgi:hypothetical protein
MKVKTGEQPAEARGGMSKGTKEPTKLDGRL